MSDVYKIGVAIMLTDGMGPVLSQISHQLLGIHKSAKEIEGTFNRWRTAIIGAGAAMAGSGILHGLFQMAEHGKSLLDQQDKMIRQGRTHAEVAKATADYYQRFSKALPTSSASEFLYAAGTAKIRLGARASMGEAEDVALHASMANALINNALQRAGKQPNDSDKAVDAIIRAGEFAGYMKDPEQSARFIDALGRSLVAFAGKVDPTTYQKALLIAGIAGKNMSFDELTQNFLPFVGEMQTRAGNAADQTYGFMTGRHVISKMQAMWGEKLGLWKGSDLIRNGMVGFQLRPGAVEGVREYGQEGNTRPFSWLREVVKPAIDNYLKTHASEHLTVADVASKLFRNQSQLRAAVNVLYDDTYQTLQNEIAGIKQSMPLKQQYQQYVSNNPVGVEQAYENQKKAMLEAIGAPLMQAAIPVMKSITSLFNQFGEFASKHGTTIKVIGVALAALGAGLLALGTVLIGGAIIGAIGVGGWLIAGIAALGTALTSAYMLLKDTNWKAAWDAVIGSVKAGVQHVIDAISHLASWLRSFLPGGGAGALGVKPSPYTGMPQMDHRPLGPAPSGLGKQGYNAVPPSSGGRQHASVGDVYLDHRKVGEIVSRTQAQAMNGPLHGSAFYDGSATWVPADFAFARG